MVASAQQKSAIGSEFGQSLRAGQQPQIEAYLDRLRDAANRDERLALELFDEISSDEILFRREAQRQPLGAQLRLQDYLARFPLPAQQARLSAVFAKLPLQPGDRLKQFELQHLLGQGGMGEVWRARDLNVTDAERCVALKVIKREFEEQSPHALRRFRSEIAAIANLRHANVVPMFGVDEAEGRIFYTMEYVETSLAKRIKQHQPTDIPRDTPGASPIASLASARRTTNEKTFSDDAVARLMVQAARGVHYAHTRAVIHRDLKPDNLLLRSPPTESRGAGRPGEETLLVADFGLAKILEAESDARDQQRSQVGTPHYAAPEQRAGTASVQSDIYSLGATMAAMLCGHPPRRPAETHDTDLGPLVGGQRPAIHRDLEAICLKCLRREPSQRFSSAHELAAALERFLQRKQRAWTRLLQGAIAALALTILAISASAAVVFKRNADTIAKVNSDLVVANTRSEARRLAAEQRRKLIQTHLYAAELTNFTKAREAGRFDQVYAILDATSPQRTGDDLRGWEWYHLYDLSHEEVLRFERHPASITACALSPDEQTAASGDRDGNVLIWNVKTGTVQHQQQLFSGAVLKLTFSPSGNRLAAGSEDTTAVILDVASGELLHTVAEHILGVPALAFGPEGDLLVTGGVDGTVKVTQKSGDNWLTTTLPAPISPIRQVWVDRTGSRLAVLADNQTLRFWERSDGQWHEGQALDGLPSLMALSPNFEQFAVWLEDEGHIAVVDVESKALLWSLAGFETPLREMAFGPEAAWLASADEEGNVDVRELPASLLDETSGGQPRGPRIAALYQGAATTIATPGSGEHIASICSDGAIKVWPARSPTLDHFRGHSFDTTAVAFSPDSQLLATGDAFGEVRIWDRLSGALRFTLGKRVRMDGPRGTPDDAAKLAGVEQFDRKYLSAMRISGDRESWLWVFDGHSGSVNAVAFSPDGTVLASAATDGRVWLWDVATGQKQAVLEHPQIVSSLAFSADGRWLANGCWDDQVHIWDLATHQEQTLAGHADDVQTVAFHPSGDWLASAGRDRSVRIWDLQTGKPHRELVGHDSEINTLAFSPDGALLASGDDGQSIRVWSFPEATLRWELHGHTQRVVKLAFHPTQPRLLSISSDPDDAFVRIWDLAIGREIVALPSPATDIADLALDRTGERVALTAGRRALVWQATDAGRSPPARPPAIQFTSATPRVLPEAAVLKVLGFLRRPELMRAIGNTRDPVRPANAEDELLVCIASLPCSSLHPTPAQYQALQERAKTGKKRPPGPPHSYLVFDADSFQLRRKEGDPIVAIAIAPLPFAFDGGGFKEGNMTESNSTAFGPRERSLIAVAFPVPRGEAGVWKLAFIGGPEVAVPPWELAEYDWRPTEFSTEPSDGLLQLLRQPPNP
jgi:WD40 repeat protein/serine/threonine protein kinase